MAGSNLKVLKLLPAIYRLALKRIGSELKQFNSEAVKVGQIRQPPLSGSPYGIMRYTLRARSLAGRIFLGSRLTGVARFSVFFDELRRQAPAKR